MAGTHRGKSQRQSRKEDEGFVQAVQFWNGEEDILREQEGPLLPGLIFFLQLTSYTLEMPQSAAQQTEAFAGLST